MTIKTIRKWIKDHNKEYKTRKQTMIAAAKVFHKELDLDEYDAFWYIQADQTALSVKTRQQNVIKKASRFSKQPTIGI